MKTKQFTFCHGWIIAKGNKILVRLGKPQTIKEQNYDNHLDKLVAKEKGRYGNYLLDLLTESPLHLRDNKGQINEVGREFIERITELSMKARFGEKEAKNELQKIFLALSGDRRGRSQPKLKKTIFRDIAIFKELKRRVAKEDHLPVVKKSIAKMFKITEGTVSNVWEKYSRLFDECSVLGDMETFLAFLKIVVSSLDKPFHKEKYGDFLFIKCDSTLLYYLHF